VSRPGTSFELQPADSLMCLFSWTHPRCWFSSLELRLPPLRQTDEGTLVFWAEELTQWGRLLYPFPDCPKFMAGESWELAHEHSLRIAALAHVLGIIAGARTRVHDVRYKSPQWGGWHPNSPDLKHTIWDWAGPIGIHQPPTDLQTLVDTAPATPTPVLTLLSEAVGIGNPVARYLCTWQALAFHVGTDLPRAIDSRFFDRVGVARDCPTRNGTETKFSQFRNVLSHPRGKQVPTYDELDSRARELADDLARVLLRDLFGETGEQP